MPEQREQNDDWDWNTEQPQKYPSAEAHDYLLFRNTWNNVPCDTMVPSLGRPTDLGLKTMLRNPSRARGQSAPPEYFIPRSTIRFAGIESRREPPRLSPKEENHEEATYRDHDSRTRSLQRASVRR